MLPVAAAVIPGVLLPVSSRGATVEGSSTSAQAVAGVSAPRVTEPAGAQPFSPAKTAGASVTDLARLVWAVGAVGLLTWLARGAWTVRRIRRRGLPALTLQGVADAIAAESGLRRKVTVVIDEHLVAPVTCGVRHRGGHDPVVGLLLAAGARE